MVKNSPAYAGYVGLIPESGRSPGKEMAYILAQRIPWTEEPDGLYSPWDHKELDMTKAAYHTCMHNI